MVADALVMYGTRASLSMVVTLAQNWTSQVQQGEG